MSLLDQFRRPDRSGPQPVKKEAEPRPAEARPPVSSNSRVAEDSLPNHASEEDAA